MFRCAYQLREFIDLWIIKYFQNEKIEIARIQHNKWQYVLLMRSLLDKFYKVILIVSRILNSSVHLRFCIFDAMFNHIQEIKNIFKESHYFYRNFVFKVYKVTSTNSTNITIVFEKNAKLYIILSIFWILIKNWNYINIEMKNRLMKIKNRNAISKKNIKKSFQIIFENITRKKN